MPPNNPKRRSSSKALPVKANVKVKARPPSAASRASSAIKSAASATTAAAKKHPVAAAAALVGAGVLAGVAADRAMRPKQSVGDVLLDALTRRASTASKAISAVAKTGLAVAARRARRAVK